MSTRFRHTLLPLRTLLQLGGLCLCLALAPDAGARSRQDPMLGFYGGNMPRYPGAHEVPAGRSTSVGASRVRMSFLSTADDPAKVARHYLRFWQQRRLFVRQDVTHLGGVVSAVDPQQGQVLQVLISVQKGRTLVFPSVTENPMGATETGHVSPPLPLPPESTPVITLGSTEGKIGARIFVSTNKAGGLQANIDHFRRVLSERGYKPDMRGKQPVQKAGQHTLLYRKGSKEITVDLRALDKKRVRVQLVEVGS